ncbi:SWIM zinc finger family protein [Rhodanobacter sp. FDAARGOS 1247]|uniref:SWIM zinc finger family protein n=1 Tax=Rhodanobacter sp. FDAARGOS 1247 TaxID=2778082 RepID=UPI001951F9AF|nr:SWIM zinc finger family protein [Rhodanobacter sp. FDAARGOS 1247]QRP63913.1 SWIM zinc finger family protein [Rhodanobacter sp. FDAARGOS 1247]
MTTALTRDQVLALAPDSASAKAAGGLLGDGQWPSLGVDGEALWGECKGSGARPYQTQVDLSALVTRCSCPSRKFPCKHALALLLMHAQGQPRLATPSEPPAWVSEWLASRRDKAAKKEQAAEQPPADPQKAAATAAKREAARWKRIEDGSVELQRWMADQFRHGLARFGEAQRKDGAAMAARMVDAQASGLAQRLGEALDALAGGRHEEAIERFGLLQLLIDGVARRGTLAPPRLADLRSALGWPHDRDEVLAGGEAITDHWLVLGQRVQSDDERLSERRIWLRGRDSGRHALLLDYAYQGRGWEGAWSNGCSYPATLRFYPGSVPLRAIADEQGGGVAQAWPVVDADEAIDQASHALAGNPWLPAVPLLLAEATPLRQDEQWLLHTRAGTFPLRADLANGWSLLAFSGGHPLQLMGEWDGRRLHVLAARASTGATWALETRA